MPEQTFIALLRGINVGGTRAVPMGRLRGVCTTLGWGEVRTYIQSGNVVFRSSSPASRIEQELEGTLDESFGFTVPVIVRSARQWTAIEKGNPFPAESESEPNRVMLALAQKKPKGDAADALQARATNGERIVLTGDALWIYFAGGAGQSKLSPGMLDRLVGSPVTTRNWRTVVKLGELARG